MDSKEPVAWASCLGHGQRPESLNQTAARCLGRVAAGLPARPPGVCRRPCSRPTPGLGLLGSDGKTPLPSVVTSGCMDRHPLSFPPTPSAQPALASVSVPSPSPCRHQGPEFIWLVVWPVLPKQLEMKLCALPVWARPWPLSGPALGEPGQGVAGRQRRALQNSTHRGSPCVPSVGRAGEEVLAPRGPRGRRQEWRPSLLLSPLGSPATISFRWYKDHAWEAVLAQPPSLPPSFPPALGSQGTRGRDG